MSETKSEESVPVTASTVAAKFTTKNIPAVLIAVLFVVVGAWVIRYESGMKAPKDTAFVIEGKSYSRSEIKPLSHTLASSDGKSLADAAKTIFSYYKEQKAAQEVGIAVPSTTIDENKTAVSKVFPQTSAATLVALVAYHNALQSYYSVADQGVYKGYSFAFFFGLKVIQQQAQNPIDGHSNSQLIAQDQAYAKKKATYYHDQIASRKLKPAELLGQIRQDPLLGLTDTSISFDASLSTEFDTSSGVGLKQDVYFAPIASFITSQTKTGLSAVQLGDVATTKTGVTPAKYAPGVYYFVQLDSQKKGVIDAQKKVNDRIKQMAATYYGI